MNQIFPHRQPVALRVASALLLVFCFHFPGIAEAGDPKISPAASAGATCNLEFYDSLEYDKGKQSSVAIHPSGLVIEMHQTDAGLDLTNWYRIGKLDGTRLIWGGSQHADFSGTWPTVAITKEGYVLVVYSTGISKNPSELEYRVGQIDPDGDVNQSITWRTHSMRWDTGFHASIAMNDNGVIVGVHEPGRGGDGIYYRVGHLRNPAAGDYTVQWDSGEWGIRYDTGINPHVAINNLNKVVLVHQVPGETLLHYRRGLVNGGDIFFAESRRYDNHAERPAVALLDSGLVLEVHSLGGLISRTGRLSDFNSWEIEWADPIKIDDNDDIEYPALATNGIHAVETHVLGGFFSTYPLRSSVAEICDSVQPGEGSDILIPWN